MPNWRKVIVSGSDASLNSLNVTSGVTGSFTGSLTGTATTASYVNPLNQNVTITGSATNSLRVKGSGATSSTNTVYFENSSGQNTFLLKDDGAVTIDPGSGYTGNVLTLRSRNGTVGFYGDASSIFRCTGNFGVDGTLFLFGNISFQQLGTTITFNQNYLSGLQGIDASTGGGYIKLKLDYNGGAAQANQGMVVYSENRTLGNYPQAAFQTYPNGNSSDTAYLVSTRGFGYFRNNKSDEPTLKLIASGGLAYTADYLQVINSSNTTIVKIDNSGSIWTSTYVSASSFTGSLLGTATTASYVDTAQTASYVKTAQTASFVTTAQTASYVVTAQTASFVTTAQTASYVKTAQTASFVTTAQSASYVNSLNQNVAITGSLIVSGSGVTIELYGDKIIAGAVGGDEGGEILLGKPATNTTLTGSGVTIDSYQNKLRFFEQGGAARGAYIDLTACAGGVGTNLLSGGGGSTNTGSLLTTASFSNPNLTFTKGDSSTFNVSLTTLVATSSSYATTASFVTTAQTASYIVTAQTASYVKTAQTASFFSGTVTSASYATTASYVNTLNQDVILSGSLSLSAGTHVTLAGGAGTKIGTAANQRLAFFNGTPQSQPDNFIGGAVFTNGAGLQITDDATFDGYTIAQVVAALRQLGLLA